MVFWVGCSHWQCIWKIICTQKSYRTLAANEDVCLQHISHHSHLCLKPPAFHMSSFHVWTNDVSPYSHTSSTEWNSLLPLELIPRISVETSNFNANKQQPIPLWSNNQKGHRQHPNHKYSATYAEPTHPIQVSNTRNSSHKAFSGRFIPALQTWKAAGIVIPKANQTCCLHRISCMLSAFKFQRYIEMSVGVFYDSHLLLGSVLLIPLR